MASPDQLRNMRQTFFKSKRDEALQSTKAQEQEGADAINRRFTSLGAQGSGAAIAADMKNREAAADVRRRAIADVNNQEIQANMMSDEAEIGRGFQATEAEKARGFQATEAEKARGFQGSLADKDMALKKEFFGTEQGNKLKELDLAERQFLLDKETTEFNKRMAEIESGKEDPGLLGGGGILGTGIGSPKGIAGTGIGKTTTGAAGAGIGGAIAGPVGAAVGSAIGDAIGGGTVICTELHRQGLISDHVLNLDKRFGKFIVQNHPISFAGYLIFATFIVAMMQKSSIFTKVVCTLFRPLCYWMASHYDDGIRGTVYGHFVYIFMIITMPTFWLLNLIFKGGLWQLVSMLQKSKAQTV